MRKDNFRKKVLRETNNKLTASRLISADKVPSTEKADGPYPTYLEHGIAYVQVYAHTKYLGKLEVVFDEKGRVIPSLTTGNSILLDASIPEGMMNAWEKNILAKV